MKLFKISKVAANTVMS